MLEYNAWIERPVCPSCITASGLKLLKKQRRIAGKALLPFGPIPDNDLTRFRERY